LERLAGSQQVDHHQQDPAEGDDLERVPRERADDRILSAGRREHQRGVAKPPHDLLLPTEELDLLDPPERLRQHREAALVRPDPLVTDPPLLPSDQQIDDPVRAPESRPGHECQQGIDVEQEGP